jgi:hypothetical protein
MGNQLIEIKGNLSPVGWEAPTNLNNDEWEQVGQAINRTDKMMGWVIGDWLNAYPGEHGNKKGSDGMYDEAMRLTGYSQPYLQDLKWISESVKISFRYENLSIKHHRQVAKFRDNPAKQSHWLERAEQEEWSARALAEAIREDAKIPCPTCGARFDEQVWHCPTCDGHWHTGQKCKNCAIKKEDTSKKQETTEQEKQKLFDTWAAVAHSAPVPANIIEPELELNSEPEPKQQVIFEPEQETPTGCEIHEAAIAAMKEGGRQFCDEAIKKWQSNYYGDIPDKAVHIKRWYMAKMEISEILKRIR